MMIDDGCHEIEADKAGVLYLVDVACATSYTYKIALGLS
jgi:hypothetical protein